MTVLELAKMAVRIIQDILEDVEASADQIRYALEDIALAVEEALEEMDIRDGADDGGEEEEIG
jgi:hypothetical protein